MALYNRRSILNRQKLKLTRSKLRRLLSCETLETRQLMAGDLAMGIHNAFDPEDVNDDGVVSPVDALSIVTTMNRTRAGLTANGDVRCDVNNDGDVTPVDALLVINRLRQRVLNSPPAASPIPATPTEIRSMDGSGNNLSNPTWGSSNQQLLRVAEADYADGISTPSGADRPSAREISNVLSDHGIEPLRNEDDISAFLYVWGQFLDHDLSLTETDATNEAFPIAVPAGDPAFDPSSTGDKFIPLMRANYDEATGTSIDNPRQQVSSLTAWIDGSQIYGSDTTTATSLREFAGGRMLIGTDGLLPTDANGQFLAGDIRVNENPELSAIQTLFVREHNFWANRIAERNRLLSDEAIYQQARAIVIAELQSITFNEFLPSLIGKQAMGKYRGYDANVNPTISNEFSTAAFRFGHSTLNDDIEFFGNDGRAIREEVALSQAFFNPALLQETGIDPVLKYVASTVAEEVDLKVVDSLRNLLFGQPGQGGLDLVALNIQRGRDHGLADYNSVRQAYGLQPALSYADITSDVELQQQLQALYGDIDKIDLWIGVLAEDHVAGASIGKLGQAIIADQFSRLRDGDRFWFENVFSGRQLEQLENTRLSDIIQRNTQITNLQQNVFAMRAVVSGKVLLDANSGPAVRSNGAQPAGNRPSADNLGLSGITLELLNDRGEVIDTTVTNGRGQYTFSNFDETGDYRIRVVLEPNLKARLDSLDILVSNGATRLRELNFVVTQV